MFMSLNDAIRLKSNSEVNCTPMHKVSQLVSLTPSFQPGHQQYELYLTVSSRKHFDYPPERPLSSWSVGRHDNNNISNLQVNLVLAPPLPCTQILNPLMQQRFIQALAVCGTLLMPNLGHSPILILKTTYLNFIVAGTPLLIILRSVKLFSFISN